MSKVVLKSKALSPGGLEASTRMRIPSPEYNTHAATRFFDLPSELRNQIYELLVLDDYLEVIRLIHRNARMNWLERPKRLVYFTIWQVRGRVRGDASAIEPALLKVCKKVRGEAAPMYYGSHAFELKITTFRDIPAVMEWIHGIVELCGNRPFKYFNIHVSHPDTDDMNCLRPLLTSFFRNGIRLDGRPMLFSPPKKMGFTLSNPLITSDFNSWTYCEALAGAEKAIALAKQARAECWNEDILEIEFGELLLETPVSDYTNEYETWMTLLLKDMGL